jgi:hypothetical protein
MRFKIFLLMLACSAPSLWPQRFPFPARRMGPELIAPDVFRDALTVDPKHYRLDMENDRVRVLRLTLQGDEAVPVHDDRAGLLVCVTECHIRCTRPDGRVQDIHLQAGETRWVSEDTRSLKNLSPMPMEMLYIEMKSDSALR